MSMFYRSLVKVCWGLGLISMVAGIVLKLLPMLQDKLGVASHHGMTLAAVLFLGALATGEVRRILSTS